MTRFKECLKDVLVAQIPGRIYREAKNLTDKFSEVPKLQKFYFKTLNAFVDVATYASPIIIADNVAKSIPEANYFDYFTRASLFLAPFYGFARSFWFNTTKKATTFGNYEDDGDFGGDNGNSDLPSGPQAPSIEDRATDYYWYSLKKNSQRIPQ